MRSRRPPHVLRFWESRFTQIKPVKRAGGRRYYRPADVALLSGHQAAAARRRADHPRRAEDPARNRACVMSRSGGLPFTDDDTGSAADAGAALAAGEIAADDAAAGSPPLRRPAICSRRCARRRAPMSARRRNARRHEPVVRPADGRGARSTDGCRRADPAGGPGRHGRQFAAPLTGPRRTPAGRNAGRTMPPPTVPTAPPRPARARSAHRRRQPAAAMLRAMDALRRATCERVDRSICASAICATALPEAAAAPRRLRRRATLAPPPGSAETAPTPRAALRFAACPRPRRRPIHRPCRAVAQPG